MTQKNGNKKLSIRVQRSYYKKLFFDQKFTNFMLVDNFWSKMANAKNRKFSKCQDEKIKIVEKYSGDIPVFITMVLDGKNFWPLPTTYRPIL